MSAKLSDLERISELVELLVRTRDTMKDSYKDDAVMVLDYEEFDIPRETVDAILLYHESILLKKLAELGVDPHA